MNIWQVIDSRQFGGIESHVGLLADGLQRVGEKVTVVFLTDFGSHPLEPFCAALGIPTIKLSGGLRTFLKSIRTYQPDLIHTHGYKANIFGKLARLRLGTKVASSYHAGGSLPGRVKFYNTLDVLSYKFSASIAVSETVAHHLPGKPAVILENFVEVPSAAKTWADNKPVSVGFVGRLSPEKGAQAFCELSHHIPTMEFHVFGSGPLAESLQHQFGDRIQFHGYVADNQTIWAQIDVLCMPSEFEGLPLAALEAMAFGLPVVAYAVGGLPGLIVHGKNGLLVPPGNFAKMIEQLRYFEKLPFTQKKLLGQHAREQINKKYSSDSAIPKFIKLYRSL